MPLVPQAPNQGLIDLVESVFISPRSSNKHLSGEKKNLLTLSLSILDIVLNLTNSGIRRTLSLQSSSTRGVGAARNCICKEMQGAAVESDCSMSWPLARVSSCLKLHLKPR